jgi:uncharacterized protein YkwD
MFASRLVGLLIFLSACSSVVGVEEYVNSSAQAIGPANQTEFMAQVNQARTNPAGQICYGENPSGKLMLTVGALSWNAKLAAAAYYHAKDLAEHNGAQKFSNGTAHFGSDGSTLATRVSRTGYSYVTSGENLAAGQATAKDAVFGTPGNSSSGWLPSTTLHCEILMSPNFSEMGMAMYQDTKGLKFWALVLGKPK